MKKLTFLAMLCGVSLFLVGCSGGAVEEMNDEGSAPTTEEGSETGSTEEGSETGTTEEGTAPGGNEEPPAIPDVGSDGVAPVPGTEDGAKGGNVDVPEVKLD